IVGRTPAQLAHTANSVRVTSLSATVPGRPGSDRSEVNRQGLFYLPPNGGASASATDLILSVVALAILAPVLIFIATPTPRPSLPAPLRGSPGGHGAGGTRRGLFSPPPSGGAAATPPVLILPVAALATPAPVLIFTAPAPRLSAARREERFAAMRLAGATRKQ